MMWPCRSHASGGAVYPAALADGGERGRTPVNGVCHAGIYPAVICSPAVPCPVKGGGDGGHRCGPVRGGDGGGANRFSRYRGAPRRGAAAGRAGFRRGPVVAILHYVRGVVNHQFLISIISVCNNAPTVAQAPDGSRAGPPRTATGAGSLYQDGSGSNGSGARRAICVIVLCGMRYCVV